MNTQLYQEKVEMAVMEAVVVMRVSVTYSVRSLMNLVSTLSSSVAASSSVTVLREGEKQDEEEIVSVCVRLRLLFSNIFVLHIHYFTRFYLNSRDFLKVFFFTVLEVE
ncbi:hypothetical protein E2C01_045640 [Portunus trituberculatus]|uniref:Uncharacterized protein n=1 Tax=Portunus trituberculatus TaxID=210409 RepID=A0A5B7G1X5_PORTR|nr:hypothetical protein [Portunus trituberculatus]